MEPIAYLSQFIVTVTLGAVIAYSLRRMTMLTIAIFGVIIGLPLLAIILFAGTTGESWNTIGKGLEMMSGGILNLIKAGLITSPVMTTGTLIGLVYGSGLLR